MNTAMPAGIANQAAGSVDPRRWLDLLGAEDLPTLAASLGRVLAPRVTALAWGGGADVAQGLYFDTPLPGTLRGALDQAIAAGEAVRSPSGSVRYWRVPAGDAWVALACSGDQEDAVARAVLDAAGRRGVELMERAWLQRAVRRLERAERVQGALYSIADMASSQMEMQEMLRRVHRIVGGLMYAENFYIVLYAREPETIRFIYFADSLDTYQADPETPVLAEDLANSLTLAMIRHGEAVMGPSMELRTRLGVERDLEHGPDSVDWLGVPLLGAHGVEGAIVVQSYDSRYGFNDEDRVLLSYVAQHIHTALERKQAQSELERRVRERTRDLALANAELRQEVEQRQRAQRLQALQYRIAELSISAPSLDAFYAEVHGLVGQLVYAKNFFIALLSEDGGELDFPYSVDERDAQRPRRRLARGMTEYVLRHGVPLLADRKRADELHASGEVVASGAESTCWLGVPLLGEERTLGVVAVQSYSPEVMFGRRDQELLSFAAFHIASGLERKRAQDRLLEANIELERRVEERTRALAEANRELLGEVAERERAEQRLTHQALHDALTGLPNRALFLARLQEAMARHRKDPAHLFGVLFLDLDRFKVVNDSVGHLVGDELLKEAARRIGLAVREPDMVARLGGDEFSILIDRIHSADEAEEVAERTITALSAPIRVGDKELFTSASVGIALAHPRYERPEELLRDADAAMYRAKSRGRNRSELFDEVLRHEALRLLDIESDLRRAVAARAFVPYFQPIVRVEDGRRVGLEALLRWRHEERGILAPDGFLGVAEDSGLIEQIDWQLYEAACAAASQLLAPGEYVAINVSARHLYTPGFPERLVRLMRSTGMGPGSLRIELTEGALLHDAESVLNQLERLRVAGVRCQLDDFGTGYSALSYLQRFPLASLKIDRSFIAGLEGPGGQGSVALIRAILALAQSLDMEVIAEGIENRTQCEILRGLGCVFGQGFLFGHPVPASELAADARP